MSALPPRKAVIGSKANFWLHSQSEGFDLTHPSTPDAAPIYPRLPLGTTTAKVTVDPTKTALVVIDMQNFFLHPALGRKKDGLGIKACEQLIKHAIPACRKAGIPILWVNWGLTQEDIDVMPPATLRAFGFEIVPEHDEVTELPPKPAMGKDPRLYKGLGSDISTIELGDGTSVEAGRLLMRDQWNSALYPDLEKVRQPEDIWIHKNRMSALWGGGTPCTEYLESSGIKTLLFAGVNTDQCVGGSLQDAFSRGYDCLLLSDGCATTSPSHSQQSIVFNAEKCWGFALSCEQLEKGVSQIKQSAA